MNKATLSLISKRVYHQQLLFLLIRKSKSSKKSEVNAPDSYAECYPGYVLIICSFHIMREDRDFEHNSNIVAQFAISCTFSHLVAFRLRFTLGKEDLLISQHSFL